MSPNNWKKSASFTTHNQGNKKTINVKSVDKYSMKVGNLADMFQEHIHEDSQIFIRKSKIIKIKMKHLRNKPIRYTKPKRYGKGLTLQRLRE